MTRRDVAVLADLEAIRDNPRIPAAAKAAERAISQLRRETPTGHTCSRCGRPLTDELDTVIDSGRYRHRRWCVDVLPPDDEQIAAEWAFDTEDER
jgi:hypothetical protein